MKNFLRGLAAGIAIGYLTAPRSGKETREQLSDTLNGVKENWDEAKTQIAGFVDDIKAQVGKSGTETNELFNTVQVQNGFNPLRPETSETNDLVQNRYNGQTDNWAGSTRPETGRAEDDLKI